MTEDEAKTKACCGPFAGRIPYGSADTALEVSVQGIDPDYIAETAARWPCIASACMAWRAVPTTAARVRTDKGETVSPAAAKRFGWTIVQTGFCGLAGAPQ